MDKKEMLEGLYEIKNWKCGGDVKMHAVIDAVIKALEAQNVYSDDIISRQAIDALYHVDEYNGRSVEAIRNLPSAEPERLTDDDFETIRIHLNALKETLCNQQRWKEANEYQRIIDRFMAFASAEPDVPDIRVGKWTSCSERLPEEHD